jgi:hypothetical protein
LWVAVSPAKYSLMFLGFAMSTLYHSTGYDMRMTRREKALYHQIHPAKLVIDWISAIWALFLMWDGRVVLALIIGFVPAVLASILIIRIVNLEPYKISPLGRYVAKYMGPYAQTLRMAGFVITLIGAYVHDSLLIAAGFALIIACWMWGYFAGTIASIRKLR